MSDSNLDDAVEIHDSEIDAEAVMRQIRENIRTRRAEAEAQGLDFEAFVEGTLASRSATRFEPDLYFDLRRLNASHDKIGVDLSLTESRLPLIAPLVQRVRTVLHQLVLYYVNMMARQQARVNEYTLRLITALVKGGEATPRDAELDALRAEVAQLQARVEELESVLRRTS